MRSTSIAILAATLVLTVTSAYGAVESHIGIVKSLSGEVMVDRRGSIIKAVTNLRLLEGDVVQTGQNGKAGLILEDDSVISMGFNSRIVIKSYMFNPNEMKMSFITRILQGTVSYLSGQIAKLAPNRVSIETPYATVGVRGTHVLIQVD
jgi:hypothetical protein